MQAIETIYNGYRFRSRLEARWAVFFDACGVKYTYETEGYDLDGVRYLPDFLINGRGGQFYIEIKSVEPSEQDVQKAASLAVQSGCTVFIFWGDIWNTVNIWRFTRKSNPSKDIYKYVDLAIANEDFFIAIRIMGLYASLYWSDRLNIAVTGFLKENPSADVLRNVALNITDTKDVHIPFKLSKTNNIKMCNSCRVALFGESISNKCPNCKNTATDDHPILIRAYEKAVLQDFPGLHLHLVVCCLPGTKALIAT
jgi:hypothetical protein